MMNAVGKRARKQIGGNRFLVKRASRAKKREGKGFGNDVMNPSAYAAKKSQHRKLLAERREAR
jgi:hypothetical protein